MQKVLSRREFLKAAALTSGIAAVAACTPPQLTGSTTGESAVQAAPVELQWWSFPLGLPPDVYPHGSWEQEKADEYIAEHPDVQIAYQGMGWDSLTKMATAIAAGNPPNMILRGGVDQIIYALEGDVALEVELPQEFLDDLPEGWYDGMLYQGKNYMVPFYTLANGMTINLDIVEEAGAMHLVPEAPERTWNFNDYLTLMQACTFERDDGSQVWGAVLSTQQTNPFFYWPEQVLSWNWGTDTVEFKSDQWRCKLGDDEGLAWLQWMQDLYFEHKVVPNPSGLSATRGEYWNQKSLLGYIGSDISLSQRPGMEVDPDTLVVTDTEQGFNWIYVQPPTNPGVDHAVYWGGPLLDVNIVLFRGGGAETIQPSIDFSLWLTNAENQKSLSQFMLPVRKSALAGIEDPMLQWHFEHYIPYGRQRMSANGGRARDTVEQLELVLQKIFLPTSPEEAVQDFCTTIEKLDWHV